MELLIRVNTFLYNRDFTIKFTALSAKAISKKTLVSSFNVIHC